MSKDNLILFPKKSTPSISMTNAEAKWMVSGSLMVILTLALGVNSSLFSQKQQGRGLASKTPLNSSRSIASINPIFRVSWEKKAFEVLESSQARDLANVGRSASPYEHFAFGDLEGRYHIRKVDGKITEIRLSEGVSAQPKLLLQREEFINSHLGLFSTQAQGVKKVHVENNQDRLIERFQLIDSSGQDVGLVQLLLNKEHGLLSMTVQ